MIEIFLLQNTKGEQKAVFYILFSMHLYNNWELMLSNIKKKKKKNAKEP